MNLKSSYNDLIHHYTSLTKTEKVSKMIAIIEYLWPEYSFYNETLEALKKPDIDEQYLDTLYTTIIGVFSEVYESNKKTIQNTIMERVCQIKILNESEAKQAIMEAENLLDSFEDR